MSASQVFMVEFVREDDEDDPVLAGAVNVVGLFSTKDKALAYHERVQAKFPTNRYVVTTWQLDDDTLPEHDEDEDEDEA